MSRVLIIACSGKKAEDQGAACVHYDARQHRLALAEFWEWGAACDLQLCFLSAEFGLLEATENVPQYDRKMDAKRFAELAYNEAMRGRAREIVGDAEEILVYGGKPYRQLILEWFPVETVTEIVGLDRGCGDHFSALKEYLEEGNEE